MKLTTKLALIFLAVTVLLGAGFGFFGIPYLQRSLEKREIDYAKSFLEDKASDTRLELQRVTKQGLTGAALEEARQTLFVRLNERFTKFYFHNSGRLFVIDAQGKVAVSSDPTKNGRTVNNMWIYDDGQRNKLLAEITSKDQIPRLVRQFSLKEVNERQDIIKKTLFVSHLPGTGYFICISVNDEDLYYAANWIGTSLLLLLAIVILVFYMLFHIFYSRLWKRCDTVVEHARLIAAGNYDMLIDDHSQDEIGILATTIDKLAGDLRMQRTLEAQFRQAQKMEMIGVLASGIAHDFNNVLGGIMSGLDLMAQEIESPANKQTPDMELIENTVRIGRDCAERGKETVEQLLAFSRKSEAQKQLVDLNRIVRNVEEICGHSFDKQISVKIEPFSRQAVIRADRGLLEQAILNVCINARDAMSGGGELLMKIEEVERAPHDLEHAPGKHACYSLLIEDSGCGMDQDTLAKALEPFYTTKKSGTGLGLAMVYKIIHDHNGWVEIQSEVGSGTRFHIFLPRSAGVLPAEESGGATTGDKDKAVPGAEGQETILVIEDDEFMRQTTETILSRLGYEVLTAGDGKSALETLKEHCDKLELVLLDLILPGVAGDELFDKMKQLKPDISVLLVSGHKRDPRIAGLIARGCDDFLKKPYSLEELATTVRRVLDQAKARPAS